MTDLVVVQNGGTTVVEVTQSPAYVLEVTEETSTVEVVTVGLQGPPGAQGSQGPAGPAGPMGEVTIGDASLDGGNF